MSITNLKAGDQAPAFNTTNQNGEPISLDSLKGKKVVLYFYPKDSTPGCTMQACNLRDNYEALLKANYVVLGVSADSAKKHQNFIEKQNLPFDLLMDIVTPALTNGKSTLAPSINWVTSSNVSRTPKDHPVNSSLITFSISISNIFDEVKEEVVGIPVVPPTETVSLSPLP